MVHHIMGRYGKVRETDLMKNQKRFYETLDTTTPIDKYFERIDDCIQHEDDCKQTYTSYQILNKDYTTVLSTGLFKYERRGEVPEEGLPVKLMGS